MGLSTVMQTAFSGINAATTIINVTADNLANYQTPGFKASTVRLATLPPQAISPVGRSGSNAIQFGRGVQVVRIERDLPTESDPGEPGVAEAISHTTENSNVDMAGELIELTLAGNLFHSNLEVHHAAEDMLSTLFFPWRRA